MELLQEWKLFYELESRAIISEIYTIVFAKEDTK